MVCTSRRGNERLADTDLNWVLEWWGGAGHRSINEWLREGRTSPLNPPGQIQRLVEQLDSLMRPLDRPLTLFRGLRLPRLLTPGEQLTDQGFMAASVERRCARAFARPRQGWHAQLVQLQVPAGTPFIPLSRYTRDLSWRREEHELLLGRGLQLTVEAVDHSLALAQICAAVQVPGAELQLAG
jgi:hypothetical protein